MNRITIELTEDQAHYIDQLLEADLDLGMESPSGETVDPPDEKYNAFIRRIRTKLAKAKTL